MATKTTANNQTDHSEEFESAREAASAAYENFMKAQKHLKSAALAAGVELKDGAHEQFDETVDQLKVKQKALLKDSEKYIRANPISSAGIAFLSGYIVSKLFSK